MDNFDIKDAEKQKDELSKKITEYYTQKAIKECEEHEKYVGKCYKYRNKYYKVVSNYCLNQYHLTCLVFELDNDDEAYDCDSTVLVETEWDGFRSNFPAMTIEFGASFFEITEVFCFGKSSFFERTKEISSEEFNEAMDKKYEEMKRKVNGVAAKAKRIIKEGM